MLIQQDSEYIYVPVPKQHVPQVLAYVARLQEVGAGQGTGTEALAAPSEIGRELSDQWSVALLRQLAKSELSSLETMSRVFDILAERPGEDVSTTSLVEQLGADRTQLTQGVFSAFARRLNKHFERRDWPITWIERPSPRPEFKTEFFYSMDPVIAQRWKEATSA